MKVVAMAPLNDAPTDPSAPGSGPVVSLSEIVSALSFALDLTEESRQGHAVRSCLLGLRIGRRLNLSDIQLTDLYYALLLKDAGCSSNSQLVNQMVGGDDRAIKREAKLLDWTRKSFASIRLIWRNGPVGASLPDRLSRLFKLASDSDGISVRLIRIRCERGAAIALKMGMSPATASAIRSLDDHWDGGGQPDGARGEQIPLLARILAVAQHLDVFGSEFGPRTAIITLQERSEHWFDPNIVSVVTAMHRADELWQDLWSGNEHEIILAGEPGLAIAADDERIDRIAEAFADIVDAKSNFTYRHSLRVTEITVAIATHMGLAPERIRVLYRAALLHDIGKLRIPNTILEKDGSLTSPEWQVIREHPGLSQQILERIAAFSEVAAIAGAHHEKLDGSGYPECLRANQIPLETRILTLADMYGAMTEERPYRKQRSTSETLYILSKEVPHKIDPACFAALLSHLNESVSTSH